MNTQKPKLEIEGYSPARTVGELFEFFKNSHSYYKTEIAHYQSELQSTTDEAKEKELLATLRQLESRKEYFGCLWDTMSAANRLLHASPMLDDMGIREEVQTPYRKGN